MDEPVAVRDEDGEPVPEYDRAQDWQYEDEDV